MRIRNVLLGAGVAVGAVVLAPVVLPVAATAGSAVAAVGSAAVAAGTATVGAVASAATSTAVGTAAVGAMATVGTGVGAAAGAVGLSSVATIAGTSAGAAAVGTIAASSAVGAVSATSGAKKLVSAKNIKKDADDIYKLSRKQYDTAQNTTNARLEALGKVKVDCFNHLTKYVEAFEKVQNLDFQGNIAVDENLELDVNQLEDMKVLALTVKDIFKGGAVALTGGQLVGLAASTGFTSIATASTGTAIAGLHGAAATNASLAALGGGSLATNGLGMAAGATVVNALAFAPALAIGGLFLHGKGKEKLEDANGAMENSIKVAGELEEARYELYKLATLASQMKCTLNKIDNSFLSFVDWLSYKVLEDCDFRNFTKEEKTKFKISFKMAVIVKDLICTPLMEEENAKIRKDEVNEVILKSEEAYKALL